MLYITFLEKSKSKDSCLFLYRHICVIPTHHLSCFSVVKAYGYLAISHGKRSKIKRRPSKCRVILLFLSQPYCLSFSRIWSKEPDPQRRNLSGNTPTGDWSLGLYRLWILICTLQSLYVHLSICPPIYFCLVCIFSQQLNPVRRDEYGVIAQRRR